MPGKITIHYKQPRPSLKPNARWQKKKKLWKTANVQSNRTSNLLFHQLPIVSRAQDTGAERTL